MPKENDKLSSIKKSVIVLNQLSIPPYEYTPSHLSELTGINRTTIHRILDDFNEFDLVIKDSSSKKYRIGPNLYRMGSVYVNNLNFKNKMLEILTALSEECKESVGLAIREGDKVISLYEIEQFQPMKMNYKPGLFYPYNRGCYGKCLMAYHDQNRVEELIKAEKYDKVCKNTLTDPIEILAEYKKIRQQGYVISDEETFNFAVGVGIPIFDANNNIKCCVAISFFKQEDYKEKIEEFKELLFKYSREISKYTP